MSLTNLISNYSLFNEWANHKFVHWLQGIEPHLLYQQTPSSYPSIDLTLQHILCTQRFWLLFISEGDTSRFNWSVREGEVDDILSELRTASTQMKEVFSSYSENELLKTLHFDPSSGNNGLNRYEYIVHSINHSTFHRGQIVTIARAVGIREGIVNTDYTMFHAR